MPLINWLLLQISDYCGSTFVSRSRGDEELAWDDSGLIKCYFP